MSSTKEPIAALDQDGSGTAITPPLCRLPIIADERPPFPTIGDSSRPSITIQGGGCQAGVLILAQKRGGRKMKWLWQTRANWGQRLLAVWLIATGLLALTGTSIPHANQVLSVLAVAAGVLLLLKR